MIRCGTISRNSLKWCVDGTWKKGGVCVIRSGDHSSGVEKQCDKER